MTARAAAAASLLLVPLLLAVLALGGRPDGVEPVAFNGQELERILKLSPLGPPPLDPTNAVAGEELAATLGQRLFFDPGLSGNGRVACATCHDPAQDWSDGKQRSAGLGRSLRHAPSLWNVAYNRWYFWDGRADSLWSQALVPMEDPREMGGSRLRVARRIAGDAELRGPFEELFGPLPQVLEGASSLPLDARPLPESPDHPHQRAWANLSEADREAVNHVFAGVGKAIAAFERRLISRRAPFDVFVEGLRDGDPGKLSALSPAARRGLELFVGRANCVLCHSGPGFTDGEFHNLRLPQIPSEPRDPGRFDGIELLLASPFNSRGPYSDASGSDKIRYLVNRPDSWGQFKTPSLRNVARTAPYMHNGAFSSLAEVLHFYSTFENAAPLGHHDEAFLEPLHLTRREMRDLEAFLESLGGEPAPAPLRSPRPRPAAASSAG